MAQPPSQGTLTLYRKYRPSGFGELVGQEAVVTGLEAATASGRVAHAYLFAGPRGTGKTSAARILAKCLNCLVNGPGPNPCGHCEACTSIAAGTAFDVVEIDAASNRGINEIRELRDTVRFAPANFRTKVYIIDEVHMLTSEAFNALLKTLEEPPDWVVFVLATTEAHRVPATILSRCQRYEFRRVSPADIARRLADVAKHEKIAVAPDALTRLAYLADGALRDALVLLEQARGFADGGRIDQSTLEAAFGASHREIVDGIADAVVQSDARKAFAAVADAVADGVDPAWLVKECLRWFRLALLSQISPDLLRGEIAEADAEPLAARAAKLGRRKILIALRYLSETAALRFSTQPRIDLELALARIILPGDDLSLRELSDRLRALEERTGDGSGAAGVLSNTANVAPAAPPKHAVRANAGQTGALSAVKLAGLWPMILSAAKERSVQAYAHLQHATVADASDESVTISVDDKFNRDRLADDKMAALVADAISQACGMRPQIRFELSRTPAKKESKAERSGLALAADVLGDELI